MRNLFKLELNLFPNDLGRKFGYLGVKTLVNYIFNINYLLKMLNCILNSIFTTFWDDG